MALGARTLGVCRRHDQTANEDSETCSGAHQHGSFPVFCMGHSSPAYKSPLLLCLVSGLGAGLYHILPQWTSWSFLLRATMTRIQDHLFP